MDVSVELDRVEAGLVMDKDAAVEAAFRYGHDRQLLDCVKTYFAARLHKVDVGPETPELDKPRELDENVWLEDILADLPEF